MSHIRFRVSLSCANCGSRTEARQAPLCTYGIGHEAGDTYIDVGDVLEVDVADFDDGYFTLRAPSSDEAIVFALEVWECKACKRVQAAQIDFERVKSTYWRFAGARRVPLSATVLDRAHFVSRRLEEWGPSPEDDVLRVQCVRNVMAQRELLAHWTSLASPLAKLREQLVACDPARDSEALGDLALEVARSVLANPVQPVDDLDEILERLTVAETPAARLAVLDLMNAFSCAGIVIRPELEMRARRNLRELALVGPPLATRMRVAFAAIAYGELDVAERIAPHVPDANTFGGETFPNDVLKLLGYLIYATRDLSRQARQPDPGAVLGWLGPAWSCVAEALPELRGEYPGKRRGEAQLDDSAVLWLARVIYQHFGKEPVGQVAARAHAFLWASASRDPLRASTERPEFPLTDTLARGAFRVERHLQGKGAQTLWLGRDVATAAELLVACDGYNPRRQDVEALRQLVGYRVPGVFELAYVGAFDPDDSRRDVVPERHWAIAERVTEGGWLPHVLGPADPWSAPKKAIELGRSAGRILVRAAAAGVNLTRIRPELMWAKHQYGYEVTGLSPRAMELFRRTVGELPTWPLFMYREYHAPEIHDDPDDRAVAYSLAVMVAEWATGRFPLVPPYYLFPHQVAAYVPIEAAPRPLAQLLEATIRIDRGERPRLAEFVDELERMSL